MAYFNIFDLCDPEARGDEETVWFSVNPEVMYPAIIAHITKALGENRQPPQHLLTHYDDARRITIDSWQLALTPRADVVEELLADRAQALEVARRWFTSMLHATIGGQPMGIHILKNEDWRL